MTAKKTSKRSVAQARGRGRPEVGSGISKEQVIAMALRQIDADGLERFSLRNLARALGVYPAALYWHVPDRNTLMAQVVGYALRDAVLPAATADWKAWLREFLYRSRALVLRHPNIAPLIGTQLLANSGVPPAMIEGILQALDLAGFAGQKLVDAYNAVIAAQVGFVTQELAQMPADDTETWRTELQQRLSHVDAVAYPLLARSLTSLANRAFCLRWTNGTEVPLNSGFEFFVDALIAGLEHQASAAG